MPASYRPLLAFLLVVASLAVFLGATATIVNRTWRGNMLVSGAIGDTIIAARATAEALTFGTPLHPRSTLANENVLASVYFDSAGATVGLTVSLYHEYPEGTYTWISTSDELTVTSSADFKWGWRYLPEDKVTFPTLAAPIYDIRVSTAPSEGKVWVRTFPYGGNSPLP